MAAEVDAAAWDQHNAEIAKVKDQITQAKADLAAWNARMATERAEFVGVLGTGVPRLACLRPAAWLKRGPSTANLHQLKLKDLREGPSLAGRTTGGFLGHGLVRLAREEAERSRRGYLARSP